ncbi:hypothetical protein VNI00_006827 [Paramarasmius palmivorus]|uniref:F-box domain-containing protein n=1 Tax=Paramarasmius palmivorus TaxID=297713 RepID=A0AAW0D4R3_9AGAR
MDTMVPFMNVSPQHPLPIDSAPPHILRLPDELQLHIFATMVKTTQSSFSLLPSLRTCRAFRRLLEGEPSLWTLVRIDSTSFIIRSRILSEPGFSLVVPGVGRILELSGEQELSLTINLLSHDDRMRQLSLTPVMSILREKCFFRCKSITVRCSDFDHLFDISQNLIADEEDDYFPLLSLKSLVFWFTSPPGYQLDHPDGSDSEFWTPIEGWDCCSVPKLTAYGKATIPLLQSVIFHGVPLDYRCFCATRLTSLAISGVFKRSHPLTRSELRFALELNQRTLSTLHLGAGAIQTAKEWPEKRLPLSLPALTGLSIDYLHPDELRWAAENLHIPRLKGLVIRNFVKCNPELDAATRDGMCWRHPLAEGTLRAYVSAMDYWPLHQVTHLHMRYASIPDQRIAQLESHFEGREPWAEGTPTSSNFFYQFVSLRVLELYKPDNGVLTTLKYPARHIEVGQGQRIRIQFFPSLLRYRCVE